MSTQPKRHLTPTEYLAIERDSEIKHEFHRGEMFAMAGASFEHNLIVMNVGHHLFDQLKGKRCNVFQSDMRVKISPSGLYTYPDVVVVCDKPELEDEYGDTLLNPTLLVEVLSESTERYDRGKKFEHYRKLDSLQEYVLVAQDRVHVEHFARQKNHFWVLSETDRLEDFLPLPSIGCHLAIAGVYDKVQFNVETPAQADSQ